MDKKRVLICLIISLLIISLYAYADGDGDSGGDEFGGGGEDSQGEPLNEDQLAAYQKQTGHEFTSATVTPKGENYEVQGTYKGKDGATYNGKMTLDPNGNIISYEELSVDNMQFRNGKNFKRTGQGRYTTDSAEMLKDGEWTAVSGEVIAKQDNELSIASAATVSDDSTGSMATNVFGYEAGTDYFKVAQADNIFTNRISFNNIINSRFDFDSGDLTKADITSAKDDNAFQLQETTVIVDNGESFTAMFNGQEQIIQTEDAIEIKTENEIVNISMNQTIAKQIGESIVYINNNLGIVRVDMGKSSRYINNGNTTFGPPLSLYANDRFEFEIKKHRNQTLRNNYSACFQCGLIDYIDKQLIIRGEVEFERLNEELPTFTDIIEFFSV